MLWITVKGLLAHRFRLFATALAVTLGVAFTAGTLILTDTVTRTFDNVMGDVYAGVDAVVRGDEQFQGPMNAGAQRARVRRRARRADPPGRRRAGGRGVGDRVRPPHHKDGAAHRQPGQRGPDLGLTWCDDGRINPLVVTTGGPRSADEIVVDAPSLDKSRGRPRRRHDRPRADRPGTEEGRRHHRLRGRRDHRRRDRWWRSLRASHSSSARRARQVGRDLASSRTTGVSQQTLTARLAVPCRPA